MMVRYACWYWAVAATLCCCVAHSPWLLGASVYFASIAAVLSASAAVRERMINTMQLYRFANGSLLGFDPENIFASDLQREFCVDATPEQAFARICDELAESLHARVSSIDKARHTVVAQIGPSKVADPCEVFIRVCTAPEGAQVKIRAVACAITPNPFCFDAINLLQSAANSKDAPTYSQLAVSKRTLPLWSARVAKVAVSVGAVAASLFIAGGSDWTANASEYLRAGQYAKAEQALQRQDSDTYDRTDKFVALLGQKKYDQAIACLDSRIDQELIAFALASAGRFDEAQQMLDSMGKIMPDTDVAALFLTRAMLAQHSGDTEEALNDLAIARSSSSNLGTLEQEKEIDLYSQLGAGTQAAEIKADLKSHLDFAREQLPSNDASPLLWVAGIWGLSLGICAFFHRRWHKSPGALPPAPVEEKQYQSNTGIIRSIAGAIVH
jgi:tetratricopeptide (TPR) repeat protein